MKDVADFKLLKKSQAGVTLLEVLIAALVLGIGLLGVAGLQVTALQTNQDASFQSQAVNLAYDLSDRMRAHCPERAACGVANVQGTAWFEDWQERVEGSLPAGQGGVRAGQNNAVRVEVSWARRDRAIGTIPVEIGNDGDDGGGVDGELEPNQVFIEVVPRAPL